MKLPLGEPEADALRAELRGFEGFVSSALLAVEAVRACARYGPAPAARARAALEGVALLPLDDTVSDLARELEPRALRTLDAIHLATALTLSDDLGALVAYDARLLEAAEHRRLPTRTPR